MSPFTRRRRVAATPDFERILNLPVREVLDPVSLAAEMTEALRAPGGTMTLRPVQAMALYELMVTGRGAFFPMGVGTGKTLVSLLAPVVLGLKRAVALLPASLVEKTERERVEYAKHFRVDRGMQLFSYEMLGRSNASKFLELKRPDGIITDESHRLKNVKAACTRRVSRYLSEHPETKVVTMSGTMSKKSLRDFAHLLRWSLGAEHAPVPLKNEELEEWADALDERVQPMQRVSPGALLRLAKVEGDSDLSRARKAFHARLVSTPGVVCSLHDEQVDCSLYVEGHVLAVNSVTEANFETLRTAWELPDGWALSEAVEVWRHARELAIGLHYEWDPRPPDEWLSKRRAWAKFVRDTLSRSRTLDSEKQVADACISGDLPDDEYRDWKEVEPTFKVNTKAVWHDDAALDYCAAWLAREKGICWVEHTFFGRELSRRTGLPYFGQSGLDARGNSILDAKGPIVASIAANGTGKNLQRWSKNLITSCPTGADVLEQLIGRTHRQGQESDEVSVEILLGCVEHFEAWERARNEAKMATDMFGAPQKILVADVTMPHLPKRGHRWEKSSNEKE